MNSISFRKNFKEITPVLLIDMFIISATLFTVFTVLALFPLFESASAYARQSFWSSLILAGCILIMQYKEPIQLVARPFQARFAMGCVAVAGFALAVGEIGQLTVYSVLVGILSAIVSTVALGVVLRYNK